VSGYQTLSASTDLIPGNIEGGTIFCPSGQQMVGGGWTDNGQFFFGQNLFITQSAPTSYGTSWTAETRTTALPRYMSRARQAAKEVSPADPHCARSCRPKRVREASRFRDAGSR
jgi:hypothetical protein